MSTALEILPFSAPKGYAKRGFSLYSLTIPIDKSIGRYNTKFAQCRAILGVGKFRFLI